MNIEIKSSLMAAALYFVVANPVTYGIVQKLLGKVITVSGTDGPTQAGTLIHAIVFGLLTFLIMKITQKYTTYEKI